jgi:ATP-dependent DNA helicase RecQ
MEQAVRFQGTFYRPNLKISTIKKGEGATVGKQILKLVKKRKGKPGIIYCFMRRTVEALAESLQESGTKALAYHAGLETPDRIRIQEEFRDGKVEVMVATVAFGMGIDKADIRYVIHRDMPRSLEGYAQEIGRAGRDGLDSECILFFAWPDVLLYDQMTEGQGNTPREIVMLRKRQVREMFNYADGTRCRHQALAAHFGERMAPCGDSCDVCNSKKK